MDVASGGVVLEEEGGALEELDGTLGFSEEDVAAAAEEGSLEVDGETAVLEDAVDEGSVNEVLVVDLEGSVVEVLTLDGLHRWSLLLAFGRVGIVTPHRT